jgi:hypothetical protein
VPLAVPATDVGAIEVGLLDRNPPQKVYDTQSVSPREKTRTGSYLQVLYDTRQPQNFGVVPLPSGQVEVCVNAFTFSPFLLGNPRLSRLLIVWFQKCPRLACSLSCSSELLYLVIAMSVLSRVMLFSRAPRASAEFFEILGARATLVTDQLVQLQAGAVCLDIVRAPSEAALSTGYSPVLSFTLQPDHLSTCVPQLIMRGAHLDGAIQYRAQETVASLRTPDGHMLALVEPVPELR